MIARYRDIYIYIYISLMDLILIRGESMMGEMIDEEWPFLLVVVLWK